MSILNHFQHLNLTNDQHDALVKVQDFLSSYEDEDDGLLCSCIAHMNATFA